MFRREVVELCKEVEVCGIDGVFGDPHQCSMAE